MSLYLPWWPADLSRRRLGLSRRTQIVLWRKVHQQEVVAGCCAMAAGAGVAPGMTVAHARAVLRGAVHVAEIDDSAMARALRRLGAWMGRVAPRVAPDPPDGLMLDMTGCGRLYGDPGAMVKRARRAAGRLGLTTRAACAPTWGTAWALARYGGRDEHVVDGAGLLDALGPLPVESLRVSAGTASMLREVGVERVGQVLGLGRGALAARYGPEILRRLDQALGHADERITPLRPASAMRVERVFAGPTSNVEAVMVCARELLAELCRVLEGRGRGLRRLGVRLTRSDVARLDLCVRTSRATRDPRHLWSLLRPQVERAHLGFGVEGVTLEAVSTALVSHEQATTHPAEVGEADPGEVARLIDTLAARLGPDSVRQWREAESYVPERAFVPEPIATLSGVRRAPSPLPDRPSWLYAVPREVEAVFLLPDGPLGAIREAGGARRVVACAGPERISAEWWRGEAGVRDYFTVTTEDGARLWVYRAWPGGRWFIHGEWA